MEPVRVEFGKWGGGRHGELGHPPEVVEAAERSCAAVLRAVRAGEPPFDATTGAGWLARLAAHRP